MLFKSTKICEFLSYITSYLIDNLVKTQLKDIFQAIKKIIINCSMFYYQLNDIIYQFLSSNSQSIALKWLIINS